MELLKWALHHDHHKRNRKLLGADRLDLRFFCLSEGTGVQVQIQMQTTSFRCPKRKQGSLGCRLEIAAPRRSFGASLCCRRSLPAPPIVPPQGSCCGHGRFDSVGSTQRTKKRKTQQFWVLSRKGFPCVGCLLEKEMALAKKDN